jgi:glycosyltransferase involved in cell wall biosynthesis
VADAMSTGPVAVPSPDAPAISVVVATFRRAQTLGRTLEHLAAQDLPAAQFEVIVVDDGSGDETAASVAAMVPRMPCRIEYMSHDNRGPGFTQNRGIRAARAPVVLLVADDVFLGPRAVRAHLEMHRRRPEPEVAVQGKVVQSPELVQSAFLRKWDPFRFHEIEGLDELPPYRIGACNLSLKREFVLRHGGFLEHRGRGGAAALEDVELGCRLHGRGMRLLYARDALGFHHHVSTLDQAIARWYERGLNFGEFRRHAPDPELTVYFHVLNARTAREYLRVMRGKNSFRGAEASLAWHLVRHAGRMVTLNRVTARWIWRPLLDLAERSPVAATLVTAKTYRAFLYYHFLRGERAGHERFDR